MKYKHGLAYKTLILKTFMSDKQPHLQLMARIGQLLIDLRRHRFG
jgi:hypothetical protein